MKQNKMIQLNTLMRVMVLMFCAMALAGVNAWGQGHAGEDEHGHAEEKHEESGDEHAEGHDEHGHEEGVVRLDEQQLAALKISMAEVRRGTLQQSLTLPGEVQWNSDRVVHVSPRVPGVVVEVQKTLGERVTKGEVLTLLDSAEIGEARMAYLEAISAHELAAAELDQLEQVAGDTRRLLEILDANPDAEEALSGAGALRIGADKSRLLEAYTQQRVARRNWEREEQLRAKEISSEAEYLEAQSAYETARATYQGMRESIGYELDQQLLQKRNETAVARTRMKNAERTLHVKGLTNEQTEALRRDAEVIDEEISRVQLTAPIDGLIVDRHLSPGEQVTPETELYKIADTSQVWFMGRANERDLQHLVVGAKAAVRLDAFAGAPFEGTVDYIASELDPDSRTVAARVVLPNEDRRLRAGLFGQVTIFGAGEGAGLLVPASALQRTAQGMVVFKQHAPGEFEMTPVTVAAQDGNFAQVSGALNAGDQVAAGDTLTLKTEAEREALGGGHSH